MDTMRQLKEQGGREGAGEGEEPEKTLELMTSQHRLCTSSPVTLQPFLFSAILTP